MPYGKYNDRSTVLLPYFKAVDQTPAELISLNSKNWMHVLDLFANPVTYTCYILRPHYTLHINRHSFSNEANSKKMVIQR